MTENIEPQFDIAAQEARELARRATLPMPDVAETVVVGDASTMEAPGPADIQADISDQSMAEKSAGDQAEASDQEADTGADTGADTQAP